jgi:hypothetical protein
MNQIDWPMAYLPGVADFYVSNEAIVARAHVAPAWDLLTDLAQWPALWTPLADGAVDGGGTRLAHDARFTFSVGGTAVRAEIVEWTEPLGNEAGRIAWHGWIEEGDTRVVDAYSAWLLEALPGERLRVLWQETLNGPGARAMAAAHPNPAVGAHQEWVDGLAAAARAAYPGA